MKIKGFGKDDWITFCTDTRKWYHRTPVDKIESIHQGFIIYMKDGRKFYYDVQKGCIFKMCILEKDEFRVL